MKTYLVTGGAGFIGANFVLHMLRERDDVRIVDLDKLTYAGDLENLRSVMGDRRHTFVRGDICDAAVVSRVFAENDIDRVVNFAAESHVDRSIADPGVFVQTNVVGTLRLLQAARNAWERPDGTYGERRFLQVSTDEVYGSLGAEGLFTEATPLSPHSPYSASKASADLLVKAYGDTYGLPVSITRCSNNYGPYQFPEKLIPLAIDRALHHRTVPVYGDGMNVRDWLFVEDHCRAIDLVLERGRPGEAYNIGGHNERTNLFIVRRIIEHLGAHVDPAITEALVTHVPDRKGHDRRYGIDATKIEHDLGWRPEVAFEDGIARTIQWYLDNREWMEHITSGAYRTCYAAMYGGL